MKVLKVLCVVVAILAAAALVYFIYAHFTEQMEEEEALDTAVERQVELAERVVTEVHDPVDTSENEIVAPIEIDWKYLNELNPDIKAWIYIPGTYISFPLLQERVLAEYYYLNHDYAGNYLATGAVFTPAEPVGIEDAHMLVFAHHTGRENVGFSGLHGMFGTEDAAREHAELYVLYPDHTELWTPWCSVDGRADDPVYEIPYLIETDSYDVMLRNIETAGLFTFGDRPSNEEPTVVLSTCNGGVGTMERFYVVFKKVR